MCRTTALFALAGAMSALCNATTAPVRAPVCRRTAVRCSATLPRRGALLAAVTLPLLAYAPLALAEANYTAGPSGLQYQDTVVGTGASAASGDVVTVGYLGTFADSGAKFDGNARFTFGVGKHEVITGWDLGVLGDAAVGMPAMQVGGTRLLRIPAPLAYGQRGAGCRGPNNCVIPPDSMLDFVVELKSIR